MRKSTLAKSALVRSLRFSFSFVSALAFFAACNKNSGDHLEHLPKHQLEELAPIMYLKKGQAFAIRDKRVINDSMAFVSPPKKYRYEWKSVPDNGCVSYGGFYQQGLATITFNCAGTFQLFAHIYDAASNQLVAITDTIVKQVADETLKKSQPLKASDVLVLRAIIGESSTQPTGSNNGARKTYIYFAYSTSQSYEYNPSYNKIDMELLQNGNVEVFKFADTVRLMSYPFAAANGQSYPVQGGIVLSNVQIGVPREFAIVWLGKTYNGRITATSKTQTALDWDNSGSVRFN